MDAILILIKIIKPPLVAGEMHSGSPRVSFLRVRL